MELNKLISLWFDTWVQGDFHNLPISNNFKHTSPFGVIKGKQEYLDVVEGNKDKFLGYQFEIQDVIHDGDKACVRYTAKQGANFSLEVSEWYYVKDHLIQEIIAYYHIGEIREERKIDNY